MKKYQIFVSSTYEDLKEERKKVIEAILEMGHIPVGMEMFSAGDDEQWALIQRTIDDCDYYVVILARCCGSFDGATSYTEKEYDYAGTKGIPRFGFILDAKASWRDDQTDKQPDKIEYLRRFKGKVSGIKMVSFWSDGGELSKAVSIALMKGFVTHRRSGWVPASEEVGANVIAELTRLSRENADLRTELTQAKQSKKDEANHELVRLAALLEGHQIELSFYYNDSPDWEDGHSISLRRAFELLAPEIMVEGSEMGIADMIAFSERSAEREALLREEWPIPSNSVIEWLADLQALGLVEPSPLDHELGDNNRYWSITAKGKDLYAMLRLPVLERGLASPGTAEPAPVT